MTTPQASSRLEMLQARFQQKQLQEKEQKLLQLYDQQQQRAYQVVQRGSAGSNDSNHSSTTIKTSTTTTSTSQGGKVRQMFDERRQTTVKGIDRSYPLEPLENKLRKQTNTNNVAMQRNGNVTVNRQSVSVRRVARADVNSNVNNGKPVVSYHEEITRESFEPPTHRHTDEDELVENRVATFANGYYRHDADNQHRVRNDLESEEFPEYLMDMSDKLPKKNATKKLTQAEARLERFKNANAKRNDMLKQSSNKRSKQTVPARSNVRNTKSPSPDSAARMQLKTNTRGNVPASPSKNSDVALKRASANSKNQNIKPSRKSAKDADSIGSKTTTTEAIDTIDGEVLQNNSPHEFTTKTSDVFKQQITSNASDRPISSVLSNSSANSTQSQSSNTKSKMTTKTKTPADNLVACNICERRFARDRISYHEQICAKTTNKKRKKFDTTMFRVKGTELEPFVKKGLSKKQETTKKPEVKSNWRRKHEDFINTIRSAKQYQAAVAKGVNPADLPPPPPSDTSDYIQCPHCGRKFNEAAAERHITKCENMLHNKPMHIRAKLRR